MSSSASLSEDAARLQAVAAALREHRAARRAVRRRLRLPHRARRASTTYHVPHDPASGEAALTRDLAADGGDLHQRIGIWQQASTASNAAIPLRTRTTVGAAVPFDAALHAATGE